MRNTGVVRAPHSSISQAPVSSPAPFSAAVPQKYGWLNGSPACGQTAVTPVWSGHGVRVAHADARDVGDGVRRAGRELSHDEAVIAGAHRAKLAGRRGALG